MREVLSVVKIGNSAQISGEAESAVEQGQVGKTTMMMKSSIRARASNHEHGAC